MSLIVASPVAALRNFVRDFQQRRADVGRLAFVYPIAARPEQFLEFYLQEPYLVRSCESGLQELAPRAVVVGPCTYRRVELVLRGHLEVFTIHFQPSGFHDLFGLPMSELADRACEARSVVDVSISEIEQKLWEAPNFDERVRIATAFLLRRATGRAPNLIAAAAGQMLRDRGMFRVSEAAMTAGLSVRQFERRFYQQVGVTPKQYAGIVRFHSALHAKLTNEERSWTDIAHETGYFDQMHMVHDFRRFSGGTPTELFASYATLPAAWR
jgi:AraC-like DNA-binding protein